MSAEVHHTEHVPEWKIREVEEVAKRIDESPVVGLVGVADIPASQLQSLREELRENVTIKVVRNNIALRALEKCSEDVGPLADYIESQTAFIFTDVNPFKLCKMLDEKKQAMPIKAGGVAPGEIVIEKGDTPFSPGPMVGTLQSAGIPAAIKSGKVVVNQTTTVAKEGDRVSAQLAQVLAAMEIFPRQIGLDLRAVYEGGLTFKAEDLAIDVEGILSQISMCASKAFGLAVEIAYTTPETIEPIIQSASFKARNLVVECAIPVPGMMDLLLGKAASQASALSSFVEGGNNAPEAAPVGEAEGAKPVDEKADEADEENEEDAGVEGLGALFG